MRRMIDLIAPACLAAAVVLAAGCEKKNQQATAGGGESASASNTPATEVALRQFNGDPKVASQGRGLFLQYNCVGCHGGLAGGAMGPSLRDTVWKYGGTDSAIAASIRDGRPLGMPTWKGMLSDDQIKTLVVYIRSLRTNAEPNWFFGTPGDSAITQATKRGA
jgi:cytochrome c oxidase cbb3-type subunit III